MEPVRCANCQALQRRLRDLQAENERLRRLLDEATRGAEAADPEPFPGEPTLPGACSGQSSVSGTSSTCANSRTVRRWGRYFRASISEIAG